MQGNIDGDDPTRIEVIEQPKKRSRRLTESKRAEIVELGLKENLSTRDIAKLVGCSQSKVSLTLSKFKNIIKNIDKAQDYRNHKADLLSAAQLTALESAFSPGKLKKASFLSTITAVEKLNTMERLDQDKSTANIAHGFGKLPKDNDAK